MSPWPTTGLERLRGGPMADAREAAKAEFQRFDADGDGLLTADEIRKANLALGGLGATEAEIEAFIAAADRDGDGRITLDEFAGLVGGGKCEKTCTPPSPGRHRAFPRVVEGGGRCSAGSSSCSRGARPSAVRYVAASPRSWPWRTSSCSTRSSSGARRTSPAPS